VSPRRMACLGDIAHNGMLMEMGFCCCRCCCCCPAVAAAAGAAAAAAVQMATCESVEDLLEELRRNAHNPALVGQRGSTLHQRYILDDLPKSSSCVVRTAVMVMQ
jgi:hypothetical protein